MKKGEEKCAISYDEEHEIMDRFRKRQRAQKYFNKIAKELNRPNIRTFSPIPNNRKNIYIHNLLTRLQRYPLKLKRWKN